MKSTMVRAALGGIALMMFAMPAVAQTVPDASPARCEDAKFYFKHYGPVVTLVWHRPAVFPQPAKPVFERDFAIDCPDFSAQNSGGTFRIRGKNIDDAYRRLGDDLYALYVDGYEYPNLKVGFFHHYVKFVFTPSSLKLEGDNPFAGQIFFRNAVIGAKVNDGDLQPLYFEGKATPLSFSQTDKVDVFVTMAGDAAVLGQEEYVKVPRLTIDAKNNELVFYLPEPSPEKPVPSAENPAPSPKKSAPSAKKSAPSPKK
jgi:hypothetical protein